MANWNEMDAGQVRQDRMYADKTMTAVALTAAAKVWDEDAAWWKQEGVSRLSERFAALASDARIVAARKAAF